MLQYIFKADCVNLDNMREDIMKTYWEEKKVVIEVKGYRDNRTNAQNKLLRWQVYKEIAKDTGYLPEQIHWYCKGKFLLDRSWKIPCPKSTTELNTKEFGEYVDKIVRRASQELGLFIELPSDLRELRDL